MKTARLIYAASDTDADLLFTTCFSAPDAFLWWMVDKETHIALSPLEIDRGHRDAQVDHIHAPAEFLGNQSAAASTVDLIRAIAKHFKFNRVEVPASFPSGLAFALQKSRIAVIPVDGPFFPERITKNRDQVEHVRKGVRLAEAGLARALEILRASDAGPRQVLRWAGSVLTSERLRGEIDATIIKLGGLPANTIVAGGEQACDPHERGSGPLRGNEAIILDIFPRDQKTGYFGDLTRTVVRGRATPELRKLYDTVADGKKWVMSHMKAGVDGKKLHQSLVERFTKAGFPTEQKDGRWTGFFHGTGHGLGLEIHEAPRFAAGKFLRDIVITVEPGLYYPGLGGVRLEDVVVVKTVGVENLTRAPQVFEI